MEPVVNTTFPVLLPMLQQLLAAPANSGDQVRLACGSFLLHALVWLKRCAPALSLLPLLSGLEEHRRICNGSSCIPGNHTREYSGYEPCSGLLVLVQCK